MRLALTFPTGVHDVDLPNMTHASYRKIEQHFLRLMGERQPLRETIAATFDYAVEVCPRENPSDIWHHVIYRLFIAHRNGANPGQSWVRASGDALESFLVDWYNPILGEHGIRLSTLFSETAKKLALKRMGIADEVGGSKVDVLVEREGAGRNIERGFGVVGGLHVKASLAERVSDDIPASRIMMREQLLSCLLTLDIKSFPPPHGDLVNRGELGTPDHPSDKRRYIEVHGDFSAGFSYNTRSVPSRPVTASGRRIHVVYLNRQPDAFVEYLVQNVW